MPSADDATDRKLSKLTLALFQVAPLSVELQMVPLATAAKWVPLVDDEMACQLVDPGAEVWAQVIPPLAEV